MPAALPDSIDFGRLRRAAEAEACRRSLAEFVRLAWPIIEPGTPLLWNWHIPVICSHLEAVTRGDIRRLIINIPPGHCKSLLVSVFWPAWEWIDNPTIRSQFGSHDETLAFRDSMKTRDLVTSSWYRETFQPGWKLKNDQNQKSYFINDRHGFRRAFGLHGKITGWRGHKIVIDDPLDAKNQFNRAVKDAAQFIWDKVLSTRVNDPRTARYVLVMQRLADDDLSGRLLKRGNCDHLCLPSEFEPDRRTTTSIGWTDPRTVEGELLFPEMFTREVLDDLRENSLGSEGYAGQHQQRPVPSEGGRFKSAWFRYWKWEDEREGLLRLHREPGDDGELIRLAQCSIFATVDVACTEGRQNDWTVYSVWASTRHGDLLLLDEDRGKWQEPESIRHALLLRDKWPAIACFVVEATGVGRPLGQQLRFRNQAVRLVEATVDKVIMSMAAVVKAESGQVFLPTGPAWLPGWLEEITLFPGGSHDDRVTGLSLAARAVQTEGGLTGNAESAKPESRDRDRGRSGDGRRPTRDLYGAGR